LVIRDKSEAIKVIQPNGLIGLSIQEEGGSGGLRKEGGRGKGGVSMTLFSPIGFANHIHPRIK